MYCEITSRNMFLENSVETNKRILFFTILTYFPIFDMY